MECEEVDIKKGARLVPSEYSFQMFDQGDLGNNDGKRSKGIFSFTGPKILDQGTFKNWMKRTCDDPKHLIQNVEC